VIPLARLRPLAPRHPIFYEIYMAWRFSATPLLCADSQNARRRHDGVGALDLIYLLLIAVLVAATVGFAFVCDRLGRH